MKYSFLPSFFIEKFFLFLVFLTFSFPLSVSAESALSEEALADLVKPSVVRIAEHITGTAKVPAVKIDIKQKLVAVIPDKFVVVNVDEYLSGTGFVIHPDGYIATNAHVVSLETIKTALASDSALSAIYENALSLSEQEMQEFLDDESGDMFSKKIIRYIIGKSTFDLKQTLAVLRPDAKGGKIQNLIASGFPAEIISVNDNFLDDERDVALLKIAENNLPALSLGRDDDMSIGKKVFIFGFPATAEINEKDPSEATFTRGIVSAIKQTADSGLKVFQTDAKVSQGSSGGPLFDERGEVLGIITFQTDELARTSGDNFAFALPIEIVKKQALTERILPEEGVYGQAFRAGFSAFAERHCDVALSLFEDAKNTHAGFLTERSLDPYRLRCQKWQAEGQSRDTYWDNFRANVGTLSNPMLYIIGGTLFAFGILGSMMFWLLRQLRREEKEIASLEHRLQSDEFELLRHEQAVGGKESASARRSITPRKRL